MQYKKYFKYIILVLILIIFVLLFFLYKKQPPKIVDIKKKAIAYSDGSAEIVVWDNFHGDYVVYNSKIKALVDGEQYLAPDLKYRGGTWDRVVYSYNSSDDRYCDHNIFYMDRDIKTARTSHSDFCINKTLDEHDIKYFLGTKYNEGEVGIVAYSDLAVLSKIKIPYASDKSIWGEIIASNWELTKLIIPVGNCDKGAMDMKLFLWDVTNSTLEDKTPINFDCNINKIRYQHDDDKFYVDTYNKLEKYVL